MKRKDRNRKQGARRRWGNFLIPAGAMMLLTFSMTGCELHEGSGGDHDKAGSSRAYKGHEGDVDMNNFARVYPDTIGTRLDDCQTCHRGGTVIHAFKGEMFKNPCDYCHLYVHPGPDITGGPESFRDTLNPYGLDYNKEGRDRDALRAIHFKDSDEDSFTNIREINDLRYPGDPGSRPDQPVIPLVILSMDELEAMNSHGHLQLNNSHRQEFDDYAFYKGVRIKDLLAAIGVELAGATGISVIAPDGYVKDFTMDQINNKFPDGIYKPGLDAGGLGAVCGFVNYPPAEFTAGLGNPDVLPGQWLTLAYQRDGKGIEPAWLDPTTGKIEGEGPYRIIVPQSTPGEPDRGSKYSPTSCGDGYDYDDTKDHNAGTMVRGVIAIRVNPMPEGYEEFDYMNGGWAYIDTKEVIIYGQGVSP